MIWLALVLAATPPATPPPKTTPKTVPKSVRPQTPAEEEAEAMKMWESKEAKNIPMFDAGTPPPPFRWRISNLIREVPVDGIQMVNDVPVKLHGVVVKGRLADVIEELYVHFLKSGLYVQPIEKQDQPTRQVQVTGLDQFRAISYTAMVDGFPDGTCMVMLGEANIGESTKTQLYRKIHNLGDNDFAPLMPKAVGPTRVRVEGMRTLSYQVAATDAAARTFYADELKKLGYFAREGDLFQRSSDEIQLSLSRDQGLLNVLLTYRPKAVDPTLVSPNDPKATGSASPP